MFNNYKIINNKTQVIEFLYKCIETREKQTKQHVSN